MGRVNSRFQSTMERHLKGFGSLFYVVNPYETMFEKVSDLPNPGYLSTGFPYFFAMIVVEQIILKLQGKRGIRLNDGLMSIANGIIMLMKEILLKGVLMGAYFYVYQNHRIMDLAYFSKQSKTAPLSYFCLKCTIVFTK